MGKVSKDSATDSESMDGYEGHFGTIDDFTIAFESYSQDKDLAPYFTGLPNDQCQAPHWGYVLKGRVGFRTAAGEEVFEAGDAYYVGPGHTPILHAGGEVVEFSPTDLLQQTMDVVGKNLAAG